MQSQPILINDTIREAYNDTIREAYDEMIGGFEESWMYWPLRWFSSLGSFLAKNEFDPNTFIQCYNNSNWFFQWWFKSYLDESTLFEKAIATYQKYVKDDLSNLQDFFELPTNFLKELDQNISSETLQSCTSRDLEMLKTLKLSPNQLEKLIKLQAYYTDFKELAKIVENEEHFDFNQILNKNDDQLQKMQDNLKILCHSIYFRNERIVNFKDKIDYLFFKDKIDYLFEICPEELIHLIHDECFESCSIEDLEIWILMEYPYNFSKISNYRALYEELKHIIKLYKNAKNAHLYFRILEMEENDIKNTAYVIQELEKAQFLNEENGTYQWLYEKIFHYNELNKIYNTVKTLSDNKSLSPITFEVLLGFDKPTVDCFIDIILRATFSLQQVDDIVATLVCNILFNQDKFSKLLTDTQIQFDWGFLKNVKDSENVKNSEFFFKILFLIYFKEFKSSNLSIQAKNEFLACYLEKISLHQNLESCYKHLDQLPKNLLFNTDIFSKLISLDPNDAKYFVKILHKINPYLQKEDLNSLLKVSNLEELSKDERLNFDPLKINDSSNSKDIQSIIKATLQNYQERINSNVSSTQSSFFSASSAASSENTPGLGS